MTDTRVRKNREFFKIDPEIARDLLLNVSKLLDDAKTNDFGNKVASDVRKADGTIHPMSKPTTFDMLNIPVGVRLEPVTRRYPEVTTADSINLVRLADGEEKTISRAVVDATGGSLNGFSCYRYKGERLSDMRKKIDKNYLPSHKR